MADYRIVCVVRDREGGVEALGYSEDGNAVMYDGLWTLQQARHAIEDGHRLYMASPTGGDELDLGLDDLHIRSRSAESTGVDHLPGCG